MIKIVKEVQGWVSPGMVMELFRSTTNHNKVIPSGCIGYADDSLMSRSFISFPGAKEPLHIPLPRGYNQRHMIVAPIEDIMGFSLTSVGGTKVVGGREWATEFQVRIDWEVLYNREGAWHFLAQPVYLKSLGLKAEYPKHERHAICSVLGYDPFCEESGLISVSTRRTAHY
jgi:hypothetical protein